MTHRVETATRKVAVPTPRAHQNSSDAVEAAARTPAVVAVSTVLAVVSLALTLLVITGSAAVLPAGLRASVVCLVALTLPGLPIAALLRLPFNGIFGSVTIAISAAVNILLAQISFTWGPRPPSFVPIVVLVTSAIAIWLLARRWQEENDGRSLVSAITPVSAGALLAGGRRNSVGLLAISLILFTVSVSRMKTAAAEALGVLQILGWDYFLGLLVLSVVLVIEYRRSAIDRSVIALANVVLIVFVTMPVAWADRTAPFPTAYTHASIVDWMVRLGGLPPPVDARISWAGFFSAAAQLTSGAGLTESGVFLPHASLVFGILMIFPVYAIGLVISGKPKAAWLGVSVYVLFNWYQQDYFAPQAIAMQFYATIIAVLLWQLRSANVPAVAAGPWYKRIAATVMRVPGRVDDRDARWTLCIEMILVLIIAAQVVAHQLTPIATIVALAMFAVLGTTRSKLLWLAGILLFVAWFTYGGRDFWIGHLGDIVKDIGGVDQNLTSSVQKPVGDPTYGQMQYLRIAASLLIVGCAALSWLRLPRTTLRPILAALSIAPFSLILVQSYGGEVAIRCFLYASPVLASLAALVLFPLLDGSSNDVRRQWARAASAVLVFFTLGVWVVTDRGLNTSFEHTTAEELVVSKRLVEQVDPEQISFWGQGAIYGVGKIYELGPDCLTGSSEALAKCTNLQYFVDSIQDEKYLQYKSGIEPDVADRAIEILLSEKEYEMIYEGHDIRVFKKPDAPAIDMGAGR